MSSRRNSLIIVIFDPLFQIFMHMFPLKIVSVTGGERKAKSTMTTSFSQQSLSTRGTTEKNRRWGFLSGLLNITGRKNASHKGLLQQGLPNHRTTAIDMKIGAGRKITLEPNEADWSIQDTDDLRKSKKAKKEWTLEHEKILKQLKDEREENQLLKYKIEILLDLVSRSLSVVISTKDYNLSFAELLHFFVSSLLRHLMRRFLKLPFCKSRRRNYCNTRDRRKLLYI